VILYFVNGSHQKKKLIESDFADDLYDVLMDFFEEHKHFPRFLQMENKDKAVRITFESASEHFLVEDINEDEASEFEEIIKEYHR